jgi:hypothetical protein
MAENYLEELPRDIYNELCDFVQPKLDVIFDIKTNKFHNIRLAMIFHIKTKYYTITGTIDFYYNKTVKKFTFGDNSTKIFNVNKTLVYYYDDKVEIKIPPISFYNQLLKLIKKDSYFDIEEFDELYIDDVGDLCGKSVRQIVYEWGYVSKNVYFPVPPEWVPILEDTLRYETNQYLTVSNGILQTYYHFGTVVLEINKIEFFCTKNFKGKI